LKSTITNQIQKSKKTMNKLMKIGFMAVLLVFLTNSDVLAQRRGSDKKKETEKTEETQTPPTDDKAPETKETKKTVTKKTKSGTDNYFDESGGFKHRLQYGIHSNTGLLSFFNGSLNIRVEPSVGYKITNWAMAGLTGGLEYFRQKSTDRVESANIYNYGVYGRIKAFRTFYLHLDYRAVTGKYSTKIIGTDIKQSATDKYRPEANVGVVYRSGSGAWGYEIMGVYNVNHRDGLFSNLSNKSYSFRDSPIDLKIGFTYNF
jgi:hypothetical protein